MRVDRSVIDPDFVVEMRAGRTTAEANVADAVTPMDLLAGNYREVGQVPVPGADAAAVLDHYSAAVAAKEVSEGDHSIRRSDHRSSEGCRNIHPAVKRAFPVERVDALAERARNGAFHGPEVGGCVGDRKSVV